MGLALSLCQHRLSEDTATGIEYREQEARPALNINGTRSDCVFTVCTTYVRCTRWSCDSVFLGSGRSAAVHGNNHERALNFSATTYFYIYIGLHTHFCLYLISNSPKVPCIYHWILRTKGSLSSATYDQSRSNV